MEFGGFKTSANIPTIEHGGGSMLSGCFAGYNRMFQQEGNAKHGSKLVLDWIKQTKLLEWLC